MGMKKFLLLVLCIMLTPQIYSQWTSRTSPLPNFIHGLSFPEDQIGYITDVEGNISKTTNGGLTWSTYKNFTYNYKTHYSYFTDANNGYVAAEGGKLFRTFDGGFTWQIISLNTYGYLYKMSFPSPTTIYIVGELGFVAKSTDAGASWTKLNFPGYRALMSVAFINENIGFVGSDEGVYKTVNGGLTWFRYSGFNNNLTIRDICFPSNTTGYMVGDAGLLYKTTDQGEYWFPLLSPATASLNYVKFLDKENGYAIGNFGTIIATTNGGNSWNSQNYGSQHYVVAEFKNASLGYVGGGVEGYSSSLLQTFNGGFPVPGLNLTSPNGNEKFLGGTTNSIAWSSTMSNYLNIDYSTNNGESWISVATNYPSTLNSYSWIVPSTPSAHCKVRILDVSNPSLGDTSNGKFTINTITVNSPNGGESWQVLTDHSIKWQASNVSSVNVDYSTNSGSTWINVFQNIDNNGSNNWKIPNVASNSCRIKISDCSNPDNFDISNGNFTITPENISAKIIADTLYFDKQFKSVIEKQVFGDKSIGSNLTYRWSVNDVDFYTEISPVIRLYTGLNKIKLQVIGLSGAVSQDSMFTNVVAVKSSMGGAIYSGVSEYRKHLYLTSANKAVYEIDSLGNTLKTFLTGGSIQSVLTISQNGQLFTGSTDTRLYAFDTNLIPFWDKATGGVIKYTPAISSDGSSVYCVTSTGNLIAYDVLSGLMKWGFQTDGIATSSPVVLQDENNQNIIYTGTSSGYLYAVRDNNTSGDLFWRKQLSDTIYSSLAVYPNGQNSMLFTASKGGYLYRLKWDGTSEENWKVNINSPIYSSPVIDGYNTIYIGAKNGRIYAYPIDFTTSSNPLHHYVMESGVVGTPAIGTNGNIYVGTEKGMLYTFSKTDSSFSLLWKSNLYSSIQSSALVTETGLIYVGTINGDLFVLKEPSSALITTNQAIWPTYMGNNQRSKVISINVTATDDKGTMISDYKLMQNYPNPFNPSTTIEYQLPFESVVKIELYDIAGQLISVLISSEQPAGAHSVSIGSSLNLASGIYFYKMNAVSNDGKRNFTSVKKMLLLK